MTTQYRINSTGIERIIEQLRQAHEQNRVIVVVSEGAKRPVNQIAVTIDGGYDDRDSRNMARWFAGGEG